MRSQPRATRWSLILILIALGGCTAPKTVVVVEEPAEADYICEENPFGDAILDKDPDEEYQRARMAFMFGKYEFAYGIWKDQASRGHADSQTSLGWMYQTGKGVKQDRKQAYEWYLKAAGKHHPVAQNNLGVLYEKGWGVKKSRRLATQWYKESAEWGYSYGQYNFGLALLQGSGIKRDRKQAHYWLELAALQGVKDARTVLAAQSSGGSDSLIQENPPSEAEAVALRREGWVGLQHPRRYTIQLMVSDSEQALLRFVFHNKIPGRLAYIQTAKKKYVLLKGSFDNYQEANNSLKALPEKVRRNKPFIRRFAKVQALLDIEPAKKK